MRYLHSECLFHLGLIEDGEVGTLYLARELVAMTRLDVAVVARQFANGNGEVIPRTNSLVRKMVYALTVKQTLLYNLMYQCRQISGVGRRADLVKDDLDAVTGGCELSHGLDEVFAKR